MRYLLLIALLIIACGPQEPEPETPTPEPSADKCTDICDNYKEMGCKEAEPTSEGHTCVEVCENLKDSPIPGLDEYFACVLNAPDCEAAKACE